MIFTACNYSHNTDHLAETSISNGTSFQSNIYITSFFTSLYHLSTVLLPRNFSSNSELRTWRLCCSNMKYIFLRSELQLFNFSIWKKVSPKYSFIWFHVNSRWKPSFRNRFLITEKTSTSKNEDCQSKGY